MSSAAQPRSAKSGLKSTNPNSTPSYTPKVHPQPAHNLPPSLSHTSLRPLLTPLPEALEQNLSSLSIEARQRAEKDSQKKAAKAAAAEARHNETLAASKVLIKRIERNKRKYVTAVQGLEAFGLDIKKVAKDFGKKFATGSSVTKVPGGGEEVTVQGDLSDDILEYIEENYKDVPEDNIELIEDKKKKKAEAAG